MKKQEETHGHGPVDADPAMMMRRDPECVALLDAMFSPVESFATKLIQPHEFSAPVFKITGAKQEIIVKHRSRAWKPQRELLNYLVSRHLGLSLISPSAPLSLEECPAGSVWAHVVESANAKGRVTKWGTAEKCCRLWPDPSEATGPLKDLEFGDLVTAWFHLNDENKFADVISALDQTKFEELLAYHIVSLQSDATAANLMLQHESEGKFKLVSIDNTCCWSPAPAGAQILAEDDDDGGEFVYWYPALLMLPGSDCAASDHLQQLVGSWDLSTLTKLADHCEGANLENARVRLDALKLSLQTNPGQSLRQLAFSVVQEWERDFDAAIEKEGGSALYKLLLRLRESKKD